jgi:phosphoribosylformylglycinamidine synthase
MVGLLRDVTKRVGSHFHTPSDGIAVLGETRGQLGGSLYWAVVRDFHGGPPPPVDLAAERRLQRFLVAAADARLLSSAHDCSDGGLAVALAECCIGGPYAQASLGARVTLEPAMGVTPEALLYGEDGARAVVSFAAPNADPLRRLARSLGVPFALVGEVGGAASGLAVAVGSARYRWPAVELRRVYFQAIPRRMAADPLEGQEN